MTPGRAAAQQEGQPLRLGLIRNFGYGGLHRIQSSFTLRVEDPPAGLLKVNFYLDEELLMLDSEAPFQVKFSTGEFPDGEHHLSARGIMEDGSEVGSNTSTRTFLSSE